MNIVDFVYCDEEYFFKDVLVFTGTTAFNKEKRDEVFLKFMRSKNAYSCFKYQHLSDEELLSGMIIKELPKPKTWPKFNNENPFSIKFNGKNILLFILIFLL